MTEQAPLIGRTLLRVDRVGSTNDLVRTLLGRGAPEGTVVVAREQTAGRGRMGRRWASPPGGLWLSVLLRPADPADPRLSLVLAVGVAEAVRRATGAAVALKWPNDLVLEGRKVGGVLVESVPPWAVAGIGLNVHVERAQLPPSVRSHATSLSAVVGAVNLEVVLAAVLAGLEDAYAAYRRGAVGAVLARWRRLNVTLGQPVAIRSGGRTVAGTAADIDGDGALLVRAEDGTTARVLGGDVTLRQGRHRP